MGYHDQVLPKTIQALRPEIRVSGVAMPIQGEPPPGLSRDDYFLPFLGMLEDIKPGHVIVSQPNDSLTAQFRGARGVVIDGGCRDIDYILKLKFPVFCRYHTPLDIVGRWQLKSYGQPVCIGRVTVWEGDFIVGDKEGVLVIPKKIAEEVLIKTEEVVSTENLVRRAIGGPSCRSVQAIRAILIQEGRPYRFPPLERVQIVASVHLPSCPISAEPRDETTEATTANVVVKLLSR